MSKGCVDCKVDEPKGNLCILLIKQALQGLVKEAVDKGKANFEIIVLRIGKAGWPKRECQSEIEVLITEAKASDGGEVKRCVGHL